MRLVRRPALFSVSPRHHRFHPKQLMANEELRCRCCLAASRLGCLRGAAFALLKQIRGPPPPALGHPGNRQQPLGLSVITSVDAKHSSDGESMIGSLDYPNLISGAHLTLDDYSQVCPGSQRLGEAARKPCIVHPHAKPPARYPRLGHLKNRGPDLPALSDERSVHRDPFRREVFAKLTVCQRSADLLLPPPYVFAGVGVDGFIGSAVCLAIRLLVSGKIYTSGCDPTDGRCFPDSTLGRAAVVFELAYGTDVD